MRRRIVFSRARRWVLGVTTAAVFAFAAPAAAQVQVDPFQPPSPSFGGLLSGVLRGPASHPQVGPIGANQIAVDQTGDGLVDAIYDLPASIQSDTQSPSRWILEDRLSPTQQVLYTRRAPRTAASPPVCGGDVNNHQVFFHRLETPPAMVLLGSACLRGPLSRQPAFRDPSRTASLRTAVVVAAPVGTSQEVAWLDLASAGVGEDGSTYQPNVSVTAEGVQVSPFGNAFFVRHRTSQVGQAAMYSIVDLCADRTGGAVSTATEPAGASGLQVRHRIENGDLFADVSFSSPPETRSFSLANCFGGPPPALRRLTVAVSGNGGVVSNPPGITCDVSGQNCAADFADGTLVGLTAIPFGAGVVFSGWSGDCSGLPAATQVLMSADRACTATFGAVQLAVSKTADRASVASGDTLTYSLSYANNGSAPATGVVVTDTLPAGSTFVSASAGGVQSGASVNWSIGTLAAGASGQLQLQVTPGCSVTQLVNNQYSIDGDLVFPTPGAAVTTTVVPPSRSPVTVQIVSVPDNTPLRRGDRVTHTITLTNTGPDDHGFLRLVTLLGDAMSLDALVDAGTGAFVFRPPTTLEWTGPLAAGASTSLVVRTIVDSCVGTDRTWLNSGAPVTVFNACSQQVGSGVPPGPFPLQRPIGARVTAPLVPPQRVTVTTLPAGIELIAVRPGEPLDLRLTLTNVFTTDEPASATSVLPAGLTPVGDPPFVPPTDAGAVWDALTRTVSWSGMVPGSSTVTVTLRATVDTPAPCRVFWNVRFANGSCPVMQTGTVLHPIPAPPATPYILALDQLDGLFVWEPGVDRNYREALCVHTGEGWLGLGRTPAGDAWIAGLPSFRANLEPLALEALDETFLDTPAVQAATEFDMAHDPTDGTLVFVGEGGLRRYDAQAGTVENLSPIRTGRILVEPDGTIVLGGGTILRIDRANPGGPPEVLADPAYSVRTFDREADGDYVALAVRVADLAESLVEVDGVTGAFTPIVGDLDAATGNTVSDHGPIALGPDGAVYVGRFDGRDIYAVDRSGGAPIVTALSASGTVQNGSTPGVFHDRVMDFVFVAGAPPAPRADLTLAMNASPDPVPAGAVLTYSLAASNLGPDAAAQVVVTDPLPAGVTFDAGASSTTCAETAGVVTCALGDLSSGQSASATVAVVVGPATTGSLSNTATAASGTTDPDLGNNSAAVTVTITPPPPPSADMALAMAAAPDPLIVGQDVTYTLAATNSGPAAAPDVVVTDPLPALLAFDPAASDPACTQTSGTVTCALGTLVAGATAATTVAAIPLLPADLAVARLHAAPEEPVILGGSLVYTVEVASHGPGDARDVRLRTLAPAFDMSGLPLGAPLDVTILAVHASRGACVGTGAGGGPPLECALGTLLPGETARVTAVVRPNAATTSVGNPGSPLRNAARVLTPGRDLDPYTENDERSLATVVLPASSPDLAVARASVSPADPVVLGASATYGVEVANVGDMPASDVLLYTLAGGFAPDGQPDGPPLDVTIVSMTASQGTCADLGGGSGPVQCTLGTIPPGGRVQVDVVATPSSPAISPPLRSRSRVTTAGAMAGTPVDPHPANDEAVATSVVLPAGGAADLGVTRLEVTPAAPIVRSGNLSYALEVTNFGPDAASEVLLYTLASAFDLLGRPEGPPLDVAIVSFSSSQGTCTDLGGNGGGPLACALGGLPAGATAQVAVVVTPGSATGGFGLPDDPLVNGASVTTAGAIAGDDLDPNAANDRVAVESTVIERLPDTIDNTASVASGVADPDGANNVASASTVLLPPVVAPPPQADLAVLLSGPGQAGLGVPATYTAAITNAGPDMAAGAAIVLELTQGLALSSVSPSQGACAGTPTVHCTLGGLATGATASVILAVVPRSFGTQAISARVSASGSADPDPTDDAARFALDVLAPPGADLAVAKSAGANLAVAGDPLDYLVSVTNLGPEAATAVRLVDVLPSWVAPGAVSPSQGACSQPADIVCDLGDLPPGAQATVAIAVTVRPTTPAGTVLTNTASSSADTPDPTAANDTASAETPVVTRADLVLVKIGPPGRVTVGDPLTYVLTALNRGPSDAQGVTVADPLPAGFAFEPAGSSAGCAEAGGTVTCALGDLAAGATAQAVVVAIASQPGTRINTATVSSATADPAPGNNSSSASTDVVALAGENVDPSDLGEQYAYGENVGWINLEPLGDGGPGVEVTASGLSGWMWGENVGWCSLSCANTSSCASASYGVTNDGTGSLAGFAWCENAGWLSFSCVSTASCGAAAYGVSIDPAAGIFAGTAWAENVGWISFGSTGPAPYRIVTGWRGGAGGP